MSGFDPNQPPEERIRRAMEQGPDLEAAGRFGTMTRLVRRLVGRAVKYERDFTLQVDSALLERIHQLEAATGEQVRAAEARLNATDDLLRDADEVLRGVDRELREADHRLRRDLSDLTVRFEALEASVDDLHARLREVDTRSVVASSVAAGAAEGFEALQRRATRPGAGPALSYDSSTEPRAKAHEIRHRDAHTRMRAYIEIIGDRGRVVELGCGRGEMLQLLTAAGIDATGVDLDELMVDRAREAGADVSHDDALDFLMKQEDASLGAIFSAGLIEHLPADRLAELLEIARGKLRPGGVFIAETPNPQAPGALKAFWVDPAQQHPLFPESVLSLCRLTGFDAAEIIVPLGSDDVANDLATAGVYAVIAKRGMSIVVLSETPNMTKEQFDLVDAELGLSVALPEGCEAHIAGVGPDGSTWRDISVWKTPAQAKEFMDTRFRPAMERAGATPIWGPPITWELHKLI